jgi:hypothetical protein
VSVIFFEEHPLRIPHRGGQIRRHPRIPALIVVHLQRKIIPQACKSACEVQGPVKPKIDQKNVANAVTTPEAEIATS